MNVISFAHKFEKPEHKISIVYKCNKSYAFEQKYVFVTTLLVNDF